METKKDVQATTKTRKFSVTIDEVTLSVFELAGILIFLGIIIFGGYFLFSGQLSKALVLPDPQDLQDTSTLAYLQDNPYLLKDIDIAIATGTELPKFEDASILGDFTSTNTYVTGTTILSDGELFFKYIENGEIITLSPDRYTISKEASKTYFDAEYIDTYMLHLISYSSISESSSAIVLAILEPLVNEKLGTSTTLNVKDVYEDNLEKGLE